MVEHLDEYGALHLPGPSQQPEPLDATLKGRRQQLVIAAPAALVDLPQGRPATLVLSFLFYGAALILAPRMSKSGKVAVKSDAEVA